jgi:tetratricopeptide (TPR) repeat protein
MTIGQKILILLVIILSIGLYLAPKHPTEKKTEIDKKKDILLFLSEWGKKSLKDEKEIFLRLEERIKLARKSNNESAWIIAGDDFLKAARFIRNEAKPTLYEECIKSYEKALAFNPNNLAVKINLATAIVESSSLLETQPMRGISLLREVIQADSNNIEAHLQLGLFSLTSYQFEKAIERFKKVLSIDSTRVDVYVYLGDAYVKLGNTAKAIECFEKYKNRITDSLIIKDIDEYIKNLKQ